MKTRIRYLRLVFYLLEQAITNGWFLYKRATVERLHAQKQKQGPTSAILSEDVRNDQMDHLPKF